MNDNLRSYRELSRLSTFQDRLNYLQLNGKVGSETFGVDRYLNQDFYHSTEWRSVRDYVIARDLGCEMGLEGYEIPQGKIIVIHHMNPILPNDIIGGSNLILDPENLVCVSDEVHKAIHYGFKTNFGKFSVLERSPNDTLLWKRRG